MANKSVKNFLQLIKESASQSAGVTAFTATEFYSADCVNVCVFVFLDASV